MAKPRKVADGSWRIEVMIDGVRHSKNFPLRRQAVEWEREARVNATRGKFVPPSREREKVDARLDAWLNDKHDDPNFTDAAHTRYASVVRCHIRPQLGDLRMEQVTVEAVERWRNERVAEAGTGMAKEAFSVLRAFLADQVRYGYLHVNPAKMVKAPKHTPAAMHILEPHELATVAARLDGKTCTTPTVGGSFRIVQPDEPEWELLSGWASDIVLGLAYIGCRVGDFSRLTASSWDRINGRLHVVDRKTGNDRSLPVFPALEEVLDRAVRRGGEWLFMSDGRSGRAQLNASNFGRFHLKPALAEAGVSRNIRVHDLRHTCASWLIRQGFGPVQVAAYMGHSKPTTTMNVYAHLFADDMADMGAALDAMARRPQPENVTPIRKVE